MISKDDYVHKKTDTLKIIDKKWEINGETNYEEHPNTDINVEEDDDDDQIEDF